MPPRHAAHGRGGHGHTPGGGPRFGGPRGGPGPGWGWGWGPCGPGERVCFGIGALFWCCFSPPPPPPTTVIVQQTYSPVPVAEESAYMNTSSPATATPLPPTSGLRELYAKEFREGDAIVRYHLRIPSDYKPGGQSLTVNLGGREFHVDVPDYCKREETVVVIAPAIVNYGDA